MRLKWIYLQFFYIAALKTFHTAQRKIKCHVKYLTVKVLKHWYTYTTINAMYQVPSSDEEGDESSDIVSASPNVWIKQKDKTMTQQLVLCPPPTYIDKHIDQEFMSHIDSPFSYRLHTHLLRNRCKLQFCQNTWKGSQARPNNLSTHCLQHYWNAGRCGASLCRDKSRSQITL